MLGISEHCIATYPGDFAQALIALDAQVESAGPKARASIPFAKLHRPPGDTPHIETTLGAGRTDHGVHDAARRRGPALAVSEDQGPQSYEFALASAAVALDLDGETVREARIALGGVSALPWRAREAEATLKGKRSTKPRSNEAAEQAFAQAQAARAQHVQDRARQAHADHARCVRPRAWRSDMNRAAPEPKANMGEPGRASTAD